jgi:hypothetical protein
VLRKIFGPEREEVKETGKKFIRRSSVLHIAHQILCE